MKRRNLLAWPLAAAPLALVACSAAVVPPTVWLRLPAELPAGEGAGAAGPAAAAAAATSPAEVWQLMQPVALPEHLDRDTLFVPAAAAGQVRPLGGARWVEPLRDALPRLLREDLVRLRGGAPLWRSPLPPGTAPTRQLRVEVSAFEIAADGRSLLTRARWSLADAKGARAPTLHEASFATPVAVPDDAGAWAMAHRRAIGTLAVRIAATMNAS